MTFFSCKEYVDLESAEMVFLFAGKHKTLENVSINLNAKYITEYDGECLTVTDNPRFFDIYDGINFKILCGQNGSGKTSIMELIDNIGHNENSYLVFKDKNDNFWSNANIDIKYNGKNKNCENSWVFNISKKTSLRFNPNDEEDTHVLKNMAFSYDRNGSAYDAIVGRKLFTHFEIEYWGKNSRSEYICSHLNRRASASFFEPVDIEMFLEKSPIGWMFFESMGDDSFESWLMSLPNTDNNTMEDKDSLLDFLQQAFFSEEISDVAEFDAALRRMMEVEYSFNEYKTMIKKWYDLLDSVHQILAKAFSRNGVFFDKSVLSHWYFLNPYQKLFEPEPAPITEVGGISYSGPKNNDHKVHFYDLSSGEIAFIVLAYNLLPLLLDTYHTIVMIEEPDNHLHPEWARIFFSRYLEYIRSVKKEITARDSDEPHRDEPRRIPNNFIISTHSPFILSDVTLDHVVFLEKRDNKTSVVDSPKNTFAGNIGEMFSENFFMRSTIGEHAKLTLENVVDFLSDDETAAIAGKTFQDKIDFCERVINSIGDGLLKKLLQKRLAWFEHEKNK